MNFKTLIYQSKEGDQKAQKMLFDHSYTKLKSVAMRYAVDTSLAEDILQETYIRIFKNLHQLEYINEASTLAWMKRITATEALRLIKKRKKWLQDDQQIQNTHTVSSTAFVQDDLLYALTVLSPRQRIVFNLYAIEGYSHKEIAQKIDIAESSSRSILARSRSLLKSIILKNKTYGKVS